MLQKKKSGLFEKINDSRTETGNMQDKTGPSCIPQKEESTLKSHY